MFSKNEAKRLRQEFWISFGKSFPKNWILYNTKVKGLNFKFHFDTKTAYVALCIDMSPIKQQAYWDKIVSHKSILETDFLPQVIFDAFFKLPEDKIISVVYVSIESKVSIHDKSSWRDAMEFLNDFMLKFEEFYTLYENTIKI
tara:strand:- start:8597 stop:9025 length:429 start_codon:yes stop_codon:yes gene_type:complete